MLVLTFCRSIVDGGNAAAVALKRYEEWIFNGMNIQSFISACETFLLEFFYGNAYTMIYWYHAYRFLC